MKLAIAGLLLLIGVATFLLIPMYLGMRRQERQGKWPRVQALVTAHRIRRVGAIGFREYEVQYEYDGVAYDRWVGVADGTSHGLVSKSTTTMNMEKALLARMASHPVGSQLDVMVNPETVDEAYFVDNELPGRFIFFAVLTVFALFFALFAFIAFS